MQAKSTLYAMPFSILLAACATSWLQAAPPNENPDSILFVTVSEYCIEIDPPRDATPELILKQLASGDTKPTRTIRLSTCNSAQTNLLISEDVKSIAGRAKSSPGTKSHVSSPKLMVDLRAERRSTGVVMEFNYSVSSLGKDSPQSSTANSKVVQTTNYFELGKPKLVAGLTGDEEFYLVVTVTEPAVDPGSGDQ